MRLKGKRAVVTGAANGIAKATAKFFAREGARLMLADIEADNGEKVAEEIRAAGGQAEFVEIDVTDASAIANLFERAVEFLGGIDVCANVAGRGFSDDLLGMEPEDWAKEISLNLSSVYLSCRTVLPIMIEGGGGTIINVSSVNAIWSIGEFGYSAAKAGVIQLSKNIAVKYGPKGIRANVVCPGTIATETCVKHWDKKAGAKEKLIKWYPVGRLGKPEDVAWLMVYLASDESSFVNGANIVIDGGLTAGSNLFGVV